jgi:GNAT superfamily N-acetyltransferase
MALLANGARKVQAEMGATVRWCARSAALTVPALELSGDPRALQIAALDFDANGFFDELAAVRPASPHVVLLFAADEHPDARAIDLGYVIAETAPLMTIRLGDRAPGVEPPATVAAAGADDLDELTDLDPRSAVYRFDDPALCTLVARIDGRIVGKTQLVVGMPGVGYLADMVVAEAQRRKGIGRALVEASELHARINGCNTMLLAATETGRDLYASVGYRVTGWLQSYVSA